MHKNREKIAHYLGIHFLALFAGFITFIIYLPALQNNFVSWDDDFYVYANNHIRHLNSEFFSWALTEFYASNWHPLTWLSHAIDYSIWELAPKGHHLSCILLHSLNTFLVTILSFRLLETASLSSNHLVIGKNNFLAIALITGLLFGLHPLHVESVAWVSERKDLLCAFFYLLSLLFYLRAKHYAQSHISTNHPYYKFNYFLCLIMFLLALMSKPMAISLPFVLLLIDWLNSSNQQQTKYQHNLINKIPFFLLALASAIITIAAQKSGNSVNSLEIAPLHDRLWVASNALVAYLLKMAWPVDLLPYYAYPKSIIWYSPKYLFSAFFILLITVIAALNISKNRWLVIAWGYYLITLIPVLGIVKVGNQAMADRYTYLPSLAPFMLFALSLVWVSHFFESRSKKQAHFAVPLFLLVVLFMGLLSLLARQQITIWKDGETLWQYVIQHDDNIPLAYQQLGLSLFERAEYAAAAEAIDKALKLDPLDVELINNLAICHLELGNIDKAMQAARRALSIEKNNLFALNTLGEIYMAQQEYANANRSFLKALKLDPNNPLRIFNLAVSFDKLNDTAQACKYWRRYMEIDTTEENDTEIIKHLSDLGCPLKRQY